jgi:hypothetical protein
VGIIKKKDQQNFEGLSKEIVRFNLHIRTQQMPKIFRYKLISNNFFYLFMRVFETCFEKIPGINTHIN